LRLNVTAIRDKGAMRGGKRLGLSATPSSRLSVVVAATPLGWLTLSRSCWFCTSYLCAAEWA